jgi:hypothetical protein
MARLHAASRDMVAAASESVVGKYCQKLFTIPVGCLQRVGRCFGPTNCNHDDYDVLGCPREAIDDGLRVFEVNQETTRMRP